ncbi:MAG: response regulator [Bacteroidia bacterium]|nr:response regulator [Bacteroidia bacterium]
MFEKTGKVLVIDDDEGILLTLKILLRKHFCEIVTEMTPQKITQLLSQQHFHVVMLDMNFAVGATNGREGFHWLKTIRELSPESEVVMMTAYADIELAIRAIKEGAMDFVIKPWENDKLIATVLDAFKKSQMVEPTSPLIVPTASAEEVHRVFMFLDIKSSTEIADTLGHFRYFSLLNDFFGDISESISEWKGEIYQYVGDEVVVSWPLETGVEAARCLNCFFHICDRMDMLTPRYLEKYGLMPQFKAGFHCGKVTTGSIGTIKKEIVFSGEALAVTARIESLCNRYKVNLLLSETLMSYLPENEFLISRKIDDIILRGKQTPMTLYSIERQKTT